MVSVTPRMFRVVHCGIGVEHQFPFVFSVQRIERYSHAKGDDQFVRIYCKGRIYRMYQRAGKGSRFVRRADFCKQHKFVAANPRQGKLPAQRLVQTMRDRYQ